MEVKVNKVRRFSNPSTLLLAAGFLFLMLGGCGSDGSDGAPGAQGPAGEPGGPGPSIGPVTSLTMEGDSATVSSNPVINFTVKNQNGQGYAGLVPNDLRFTIAKLIPAPAAGMPSNWQNYIVTTQTASAMGAPGVGREMVQGTRETPAGSADPSAGPPFPPGTLVNYGDGTYTYTFATDITNVTCPLAPSPCNDAWGRPLDLSYNASLTHRIGVQTRGSNAPMVNLAFDFVPAGGAVTTQREIVKTAKCNECHNKLELHDERIETRYCVTCHNRGSTDPDSERPAKDAPAMQPAYVLASGAVDFKQMIHKIHRGADLHMVRDFGEEYAIWGYLNSKHDYSDVHFPQDVRNCTKCHDGADPDTPQGNNWNDVPSIEACGACHDNVKFDVASPPFLGYGPRWPPGRAGQFQHQLHELPRDRTHRQESRRGARQS
jgi:OmcA/MtrC family decaheme c-type cytochrome